MLIVIYIILYHSNIVFNKCGRYVCILQCKCGRIFMLLKMFLLFNWSLNELMEKWKHVPVLNETIVIKLMHCNYSVKTYLL